MQVYRGLDAASGKPGPGDLASVPHHLVDAADPRHDFSLGEWVRQADAAIRAIRSRGRVPIVAGGTGMYIRGLLLGVVPAPPRQQELRARLRRMAERFGVRRMHRWLAGLDPATAARLTSGDTQRIVRALELCLAGEPWSTRLAHEGTWRSGAERYAAVKIGLDMDREALARRLDARVDAFFERGLVREVHELLDAGVPAQANAFKAIGYREVVAAIGAGANPEAVREDVKRATRQYVKRQRTWFRREPGVVWLDAARGAERCAQDAVRLWRGVFQGL